MLLETADQLHAEPREPPPPAEIDRLVEAGREQAARMGLVDADDVAVIVALVSADARLDDDSRARLRDWMRWGLGQSALLGKVRLALAERRLRQAAAGDALARRLSLHFDAARARFAAGMS